MNTEATTQAYPLADGAGERALPPPLPDSGGAAARPTQGDSLRRREQRWAGLPKIMRWLGGVTLFVSAFSFLISGYVTAPAMVRYYGFLVFTLLLGAAGAVCVMRWQDAKGARTFLAIATAFLPAHFANLGGFVFAWFRGEVELASHWALLQLPQVATVPLVVTVSVAVVLLAVVSFAGFSAMARVEARRLTLCYMAANLVLLLPFRAPAFVVAAGFIMLAGVLLMEWKWFSRPSALRSWDGYAVRGMLYVPVAVLVFRNLMLYGPSQAIFSFLLAVLSATLFFGVPHVSRSRELTRNAQAVALIPGLASWLLCAQMVFFDRWWDFQENLLVAGVYPFAVLTMLLSFFAVDAGKGYRVVGSGVAIMSLVGQLLVGGGGITAVFLTLTAIIVVSSAFLMEEKGLFWAGVTGLVFGLGYHLHYAVELCQTNLWLALALIGTAVVLFSSYIERNGRKCLRAIVDFQRRYRTWK